MDPLTIMGIVAGLGSAASSLFQKSPKVTTSQVPRYSPEQQKLFKQITSQLTPEMIQQLYGPIDQDSLRERFDTTIGDPARRNFTEETVPELQELFASMGIEGGDAPQYQLATQGRRLNEGLAQQFAGMQQGEEANRRNAITSILGAQPVSTQQTISGGTDMSGISSTLGGISGDIFKNWLQNQYGGGQAATPGAYDMARSGQVFQNFDPYKGDISSGRRGVWN